MALTRPRLSQFADVIDKDPCKVVSVVNVNLNHPPTQIDGLPIEDNDRVLLVAQSNAKENGIYVVRNSNVWVRPNDANDSRELFTGISVFVTHGLENAKTTWRLITPNPINVGQTHLEFVLYNVQQAQIDQQIEQKQQELISGETIKKIRGKTLLGSGSLDLTISDLLGTQEISDGSYLQFEETVGWVTKRKSAILSAAESGAIVPYRIFNTNIPSFSGTTSFVSNRSPLSTEGTQVASWSITDPFTSSTGFQNLRIFEISGMVNLSANNNGVNLAVCCFVNNALAGIATERITTSNQLQAIAFNFQHLNTTWPPLSPVNISLRVGAVGTGTSRTWYVNRTNAAYMGDTGLTTSAMVCEYLAEYPNI